MGFSLFSCSGGTTGWKTSLCAGDQARASGFAAELLSLGLSLHLWLLSLRLSTVLASCPSGSPDTGVRAVAAWFPFS